MSSIIESAIFRDIFTNYTYNIDYSLYNDLPENTINEKIKKLRLVKGLTQLQFAKSINRGFGTVTKWEQNLTFPDLKALNDIINIYNLPKDFFE